MNQDSERKEHSPNPILKAALGNLSVYIGKITETLDRVAGERSELLEQNNQLFSDISSLEERIEELEQGSVANGETVKSLESANGEIAELKSQIEQMEEEKTELIGQISELNSQLSDRQELIKEKSRLEKDLEFAQKEIARRNIASNQKNETSQKDKERIAELDAENYRLREALNTKESEISQLGQDLARTGEKLSEATLGLEEMKEAKAIFESSVENYKQLISELEEEKNLLTEDYNKTQRLAKENGTILIGLEEKLKSLEHELEEAKSQAETFKGRLQQAQSDLGTSRRQHEELFGELTIQKRESEKLEQELVSLKNSHGEKEKSESEAARLISELEQKHDKLNREYQDLEEAATELDKKNLDLISENQNLNGRIAMLSSAESANEKLIAELESARQANSKLRMKIEEMARDAEEKTAFDPGQLTLADAREEKLEELLKSRYAQIAILEEELNKSESLAKERQDKIDGAIETIEKAVEKIDSIGSLLN
jgi:chromosome segregation ATPase